MNSTTQRKKLSPLTSSFLICLLLGGVGGVIAYFILTFLEPILHYLTGFVYLAFMITVFFISFHLLKKFVELSYIRLIGSALTVVLFYFVIFILSRNLEASTVSGVFIEYKEPDSTHREILNQKLHEKLDSLEQ